MFFCGCTTIVSLLSFIIVPIRPVAFIGIHTSLSVLFVMLTTMLVTPVLLSFGRDRRPKPNATEGGDSWGTRVMAQIGDFDIHHHKVILTLFVILCAGLAVGVSRVEPAFDMERTMGDKMATASLWVLVIAYAIVFSSKRVLSLFALRSNKAKMICADGIQECLETMRDIRANNAEDAYLAQLDKKNDNVERAAKRSEIASAVFVISASMILKLGIASTALVGGMMLAKGQLSVSAFFMFQLVVSRLYDPLQAALQNLAAVTSTTVPCGRMNEILNHPVQDGKRELSISGYDIEFSNVGFSYNSSTPVLSNVSFTRRHGKVTALVGPSGGGKTTISRLAARFWDVDKGID